MTVLRLVAALPDPSWPAPRVFGVDEFATGKGVPVRDHPGGLRVPSAPGPGPTATQGVSAHGGATTPGVEILRRDHAQVFPDGARAKVQLPTVRDAKSLERIAEESGLAHAEALLRRLS